MYQTVNSKDLSNPLKAQIRDKVHLKKYASHILSFSTMSEAHHEQGPLPTFPCHELGGSLPGGSNLLLTHCTLAHLFTRFKTREESG